MGKMKIIEKFNKRGVIYEGRFFHLLHAWYSDKSPISYFYLNLENKRVKVSSVSTRKICFLKPVMDPVYVGIVFKCLKQI